MPDNIDLLYEALKNNPTIKGLPEDINTFRSALNTEGLPNKLFQALKENPTIKGLPEDYSSFEGALGLKKKATSTGFGSGLAPSPVTSSAFAPVPGMGTYKEKSKPEEESPFQFGKQLLAVGAAGSRRAMANVLSTPEFIYDAAGAPFRSIGLDVPKYDELSQGTIAKYVNDYIQGTEKTVEQIKKDAKIDPQVEKGIIDNISKGNYSKAFQSAGLGIAESLPAMFMMALTPSAGAGAGIGAQVARQTFMAAPFMAGKYQEIADDPTMSESAKILNSIVNGYAETIFEDKFGSLALIRQAQKIISKQGIEAAKDFTKKGFIDAVEKGMEKYFVISAPIKNAIEEGATQLTQNFSSKMTGEKPDLDLLDGVPEAMAQGGAFGLGISAIPATSDAKKWVNKKLLSNVAVSDNKDLIVPVLIQKIKDGVDAGTITQEEADAALNDLDLLLTNSQKVPANINREEKANAVEILNDRNQLENLLAEREAAAANLDPAFKDTKATEIADIKAQIEEKNQLLKNIGNGEPVSAEQPQDFTYYERDGKYFKKQGVDGKEQAITKTTYDFETKKLAEGVKPEVVSEQPTTNIEQKRAETESKIKRKDLFDGVGEFSKLGGSEKAAVPTSHKEISGIEFVEYSNPDTGSIDVIVTGKSDNDFVGFYRIYENGKPTNKWSSKFENQSRNKEDFKTMISGIQEMLPKNHEYTESTSISTDGLRVWNQQLGKGYELQYDENGKLKTNLVAINGDAIVNDLGIEVDKGNFENIKIKSKEEFEKVKEKLLPYLEKLGLNEKNIYWYSGTVKIDLPVLKKSETLETTKPTDISFGTAFEIQDATAEATVGRNKDAWGNAGVYRERIENAGDILRELSSRGENPDPTYLLEKVDKIRKWIDNNRKNPSEKIPDTINTLEDFQKSNLRFTNTVDSYDYLLKFHSDILNKAKSEYESIPSYTKEQRLAIDLTLDLINNNIEGLESKLNEIESIANKIKEQGKLEIVPDITPIKSELTTKQTEDATKISKEPITQGGKQGDIVQREGIEEGQPQAGQREGGTGETTQPEADNRNRPVSSKEEVIQESKQEPIKKRAFIDIQEIEDEYPNLYKSLKDKTLRDYGANKFLIYDIKNLLVQSSQKFFNDAVSATDFLNTIIDIENILETLYEPLADNVTKEEFKQRIAESKDFTENELGIFNALIDTLSIDQMPIYLLDQKYIERLGGRVNSNFYAFSKNLIVSKQATAFIHEIGHFAYFNILSKEDRINYLKYMISTTYGVNGKSIASRLAYTSEPTPGFRINVADEFSEYFAEQFSQWYLYKKVFPKDIEYIFRKLQYIISKVIEKLISGKYVDKNLSDYFNKIVGDIDKIRKENKLLLEAKAKPEVPTELTKLEEKYNKDKKSLTKKELNDVLEIKRERRKKAMASLEKGNLSEEEVAIKKAAMQKLTDTMVEIIALIDKGKFKKVEGDKEPTIKQKIKAVNEAGTTKTKAMTFSEYMRDRKRSFEEGYKKGTKDRAAQEQYRKAMLNVAIEYLASKKLGKLKEAALRSLIRAASKVSNMSKLETFIKRVDLIMAKADFIEKYNEAKTLKKELDTNKKGGATQLIQRLKNINLDYLPESGIDKVIAIAKELNSKRPDMSTVIPNMKEVLDLEEAGFREAMRANYGELGLLGGSISKFMDNEEIYKNLKKLIEYQLISKEQVSEVELENAKTVLRNKLEEAYNKIKDFVDNKKTIDNLGEYLDIKKAIKAYNRTVRQIDQVMPEFAQKFELLTDADNEISQRLGKEIETALKEFKEKVVKVSLNTSANLREYALSDAFKEESGLSPELNEILSNHLANFANNMDRETMNDLSVEDIADYTFFAEQALLGYISPEIYETYSKVGAIKAKNDTMQDLESVMESDSKLQRDIAKINSNYKGAKSKEDFVKIMTEYRKHNVDSFLGSGAVSLFYNNVYFPFGTNVTRMRAIIADLTSDFLKLDDEMNGISLSYGIPSPKILGGKKVIAATKIGKLLGSDKSIEDVKNTIMILLQQLDFITNLENPEKAKEKVYFDAFINNKEKRDALIRGAKDEQGMKDLIKSYENAIEIISKLQSAIKDKNKTLSEKAAGLITSKTAETLSKTTDAGVTLETIGGVEEILNELANSNPVVKAYIDVIRKTISSFESYTEMNTMMKGEQYYSLPNYMARQYVSGNLNTVSTSDKTAQLLSGRELFQRIKKNSSATYSREGDGLKPRILNPKSSLMMHANDVMMEYSLKGIMEASLDGIALAEQQATTKGEKDFLAACKESMNLMLETEFVTSKTEGVSKMALELLNLQTTLLVGNALRQPADYGGNLIKVGTSVDGAKVLINNIKEQLGTLQLLENGNSNLKELQERDKAAYELASMLGGEFLWAESERKASQISGNISGEQVMGNKTIKLAWADRLIVSNVYLPLFIKYFEQSAKKKFNPKEFNENPQKYYLDNLKALQTATREADKFIAKTHVSKNPLTKPEIVSLLGMKLKRDAVSTRLLFSLTGYNANDSEVIKSIVMDLYYGNGNRGLKLAQLAGRVSRSSVSNVAYMASYKIIFGTLSVLIQSGIGFFDDDDDKEFAKVLLKEWEEFYQQYLTKEGLQQDLLGSIATMLTGQYQNIVRPIVNVSLFAAMKAGLLGKNTKMSEEKYKKIIRSTRSANFFTKQYAPKYDVPMVMVNEAAGLIGLSYVASMAAENAMTIGKTLSTEGKAKNIDFIAATTAGLQLANASAMLMGVGYGSGTYNKVSDQVRSVVREEQRKQQPSKVQSIQSLLRPRSTIKKFNPLKP